MQEDIIKSVLSKCSIVNLQSTLNKWGRFTNFQINRLLSKGSKKEGIVRELIRLSQKNGLSDDIVGDLELAYIQLHSKSKLWKVHKLVGTKLHLNLDIRSLRSRVVSHVQKKCTDARVTGNVGLFAGAVWLRLHIEPRLSQRKSKKSVAPRKYMPSHSLYAVIYQPSPYVIFSRASVKHTRLFSEALRHTVNAEKLKDIHLSGRHVASLADIVLKKDNEALSSTYQDLEAKENPLCQPGKRKSTVSAEDLQDCEGIIDDNRKEKCLRSLNVIKQFGSSSQPVLEKLEYKFNVPFHGKPATDLECRSSVEIKGKSVLDGVCDLARAGFLKQPFPLHMTTVTRRARNSFILEGKKN